MCLSRLSDLPFQKVADAADVQLLPSQQSRARLQHLAMSKKVDTSFMKLVATDAEWSKEVAEGGGKVLCSESSHAAFILFFYSAASLSRSYLLALAQSSTSTTPRGARAR